MELGPSLSSWIETVTGGKITHMVQQGRWRTHMFIDVLDRDGQSIPLLLRFPRTDAEMKNSGFNHNFNIVHEAAILAALQGRGLAVPFYYGSDPETQAILMQRVAGSPDLSAMNDAQRDAIMRSYIENLAKLHALEIDPSALPESAVPKTAQEISLGLPLILQEKDFEAQRHRLKPEPLLDFALWWLKENAPKDVDLRLIQGDTGPGQFMAEDGRLVALIDWEIAHVGDPVYDLAVMRMRNMMYPVGEVCSHIGYYEEITGRPVDRDRLCFHTISALLQSPFGLTPSIQYPDTAMESMVPRFGWDVTLRRGLCDALCEAHRINVEPPALPRHPLLARTDIPHYLVEHLERLCLPIAQNDFDQFQMRSALGLARASARQARFGHEIERDNLRDMEQVLKREVESFEEGMAALDRLVKQGPAENAKDILWLFSRMERRREYMWEPLMIAQQSHPLEMIYPGAPVYEPEHAGGTRMSANEPA